MRPDYTGLSLTFISHTPSSSIHIVISFPSLIFPAFSALGYQVSDVLSVFLPLRREYFFEGKFNLCFTLASPKSLILFTDNLNIWWFCRSIYRDFSVLSYSDLTLYRGLCFYFIFFFNELFFLFLNLWDILLISRGYSLLVHLGHGAESCLLGFHHPRRPKFRVSRIQEGSPK